jgi:hypothetical protein
MAYLVLALSASACSEEAVGADRFDNDGVEGGPRKEE